MLDVARNMGRNMGRLDIDLTAELLRNGRLRRRQCKHPERTSGR
jgi:hypothetical protein